MPQTQKLDAMQNIVNEFRQHEANGETPSITQRTASRDLTWFAAERVGNCTPDRDQYRHCYVRIKVC